MAAAEAALGRWARAEMELPPAAAPAGPVLRRLCSGPCAPIWEFVTRHVRSPRTVRKIRGNLLWYQQQQQQQQQQEGAGPAREGAGPAREGVGLRAAVSRLQQEVAALGVAVGGAQEAALELEAELEAGRRRRGAGLRRGAELRRRAEEARRLAKQLREGRGALRPPQWQEEACLELVAMGTEPEVLGAVRSLCRTRAESLAALLKPCPPRQTQQLMAAANERWRQAAEALLSRHPPQSLLWALQQLAREAEPQPDPDPEADPEGDRKAPPTVRSLLQECWGVVGELWGLLPPLGVRLRPLSARLSHQSRRLRQRLGGSPRALRAARLALAAAGLRGVRGRLLRGVRELRAGEGPRASPLPSPPCPPPSPPALGKLRQRLRQQRQRLAQRRLRLQALGGATRCLKAKLRPLQAQVRGEGPRLPPTLAGEGERLRRALEALGALGALWQPPPSPAPSPLLPVCHILGVAQHQGPHWALRRVVSLRQELRGRGRGAGPPAEGVGPPPCPSPPRRQGGGAELLPRLRLVAAQSQRRLQAWPCLQALVSQWWEQPAQWALAPPPSTTPFSHWLQRWTQAAQALAPPHPRPRPLGGRGGASPGTPPKNRKQGGARGGQ